MKKDRMLTILLFFVAIVTANAQYFGQNKPRYRSFDFDVKKTEHFDIYSYLDNPEMLKQLALQTEAWYRMHARIFRDTFDTNNPIIFYNNHADFQQTNAIQGSIGIGTGGVTEGLKNRVIMPLTFTNQQTNHVLGHELVHAFQYHKVLEGDSTNIQSLQNLPLWMVEGLAEYMSKGRFDTYTAMWIRDAVVNDDIPSLKDLSNPKYFPYRYGQAFWSFIAGLYGDQAIEPLFMMTAKYGLAVASDSVLNTSIDNLNSQWESGLATHFEPYVRNKREDFIGKKLLSDDNAGKMNVSPALSPDGKYVIFLSEKDVFSTELFLADAQSGEVIRRISSKTKDGHIDDINFLESAGTWSPDSEKFAYVAFSKGRNILVIKEAESGKTVESIMIKDLLAFTNPVWHSNGRDIILTGLDQGQTDLFSYNIKRKKLTKLTDDIYSEIHSNINENGSTLVFSTDELSVKNGTTHGKYTFDLAIRDMVTGETKILDVFHGANNLNPTFDHEGNIYFLSDRDGYRNMYKYVIGTGEVLQMTDYIIGISGITEYSPAIAASRKRDRVLITNYNDHTYNVYKTVSKNLLNKVVDPSAVDFSAGTLPIQGIVSKDLVNRQLDVMDRALRVSNLSVYEESRYKPKFKLDYVGGGTGIAVGNTTFGNYTGLAGGIDFLFGDILGNNQLFAQASLNGEIYDAGGRVTYINRKNRIAYGVGLSHVPLRTGYQNIEFNPENEPSPNTGFPYNVKQELNILRIFDDGGSIFAHLPFSKSLRLEAGAELSYRSFRNDLYTNYIQYDEVNQYTRQVDQTRERVPVGDRVQFDQYFSLVRGWRQSANIALVGDNSDFGLTSPLKGYRYRLGLEQFYGTDKYISGLADARYYWWVKPFSFAVRGFAYARFEQEVNSVYPFYIGQMGFVRGYGSLFNGATEQLSNYDIAFGQVVGSKVLMGSGEIRMPFTGPKQLSLIGSKYLISDLALFYDAGVSFNEFSHLQDGFPVSVTQIASDGIPVNVVENRKPALLMSAGISMRINVFGYLIAEPYFAVPIQKGARGSVGLNLIPGW
jgi:Tol biopolymer transport system component